MQDRYVKIYNAIPHDENGDYETHPLPKGKWVIEYSKGDKKITQDVLIEEGSVLVVDVVL